MTQTRTHHQALPCPAWPVGSSAVTQGSQHALHPRHRMTAQEITGQETILAVSNRASQTFEFWDPLLKTTI